jgi:polysaccharide biosynthesis protein PslH
MKILFVKESQNWPRSSGHDVHGYHMMKEFTKLGHQVGLLTSKVVIPSAIDGLSLTWKGTFDSLPDPQSKKELPRFQKKFVSYWGIADDRPDKVAELVTREQFEAVVVVGLHVLPYLAKVNSKEAIRIWYAADEWLLHHLSMVRWSKLSSWSQVKDGMVKGLYEFVFSSTTDQVWVVSPKDAGVAKWIMPYSKVSVVPNGVDSDLYHPNDTGHSLESRDLESLVFWGRLDFGPNLDAMEWFGNHVWPRLKEKRPNLSWTVYGFQAEAPVRAFASRFGFDLVPDLPDLRSEIPKHSVVILPFVSGAGIKNKFLEAAAMARPIVASSRALNGVELGDASPCLVARSPSEWEKCILGLLKDETYRLRLGQSARTWVLQHHSWDRASRLAAQSLKTNE